jgi:hypothetical protein
MGNCILYQLAETSPNCVCKVSSSAGLALTIRMEEDSRAEEAYANVGTENVD